MITISILILSLLGQEDPESLVRQLGSDKIDVRDRAERKLIRLGHAPRNALRRGMKSPDREIAWRSTYMLRRLNKKALIGAVFEHFNPTQGSTYAWAICVEKRGLHLLRERLLQHGKRADSLEFMNEDLRLTDQFLKEVPSLHVDAWDLPMRTRDWNGIQWHLDLASDNFGFLRGHSDLYHEFHESCSERLWSRIAPSGCSDLEVRTKRSLEIWGARR